MVLFRQPSPTFLMYTYSTTVLHQLLSLLPEQQFQTFVGQHEADKYVKRFTCFNQLTTLLYAQITGKECLREIESDLRVLDSTWRELGLKSIARSTPLTLHPLPSVWSCLTGQSSARRKVHSDCTWIWIFAIRFPNCSI